MLSPPAKGTWEVTLFSYNSSSENIVGWLTLRAVLLTPPARCLDGKVVQNKSCIPHSFKCYNSEIITEYNI